LEAQRPIYNRLSFMKGLWGCFSLGGGVSRVEFGGGGGGPFKDKQTARISVGSHGKMAKLPMLPYRYTGCSLPRAIPSSPGAQVQRASPGLSYPGSFALRGVQKKRPRGASTMGE